MYLLAAGALNVLDSRFDVERLLQAVQKYKVTKVELKKPESAEIPMYIMRWPIYIVGCARHTVYYKV